MTSPRSRPSRTTAVAIDIARSVWLRHRTRGCICFSNATAFETSTHNESIGRAGRQSESLSSSSISTTPHADGVRHHFANAIVSNAFVFTQVEMTGSIWLLEPESILRRRR